MYTAQQKISVLFLFGSGPALKREGVVAVAFFSYD